MKNWQWILFAVVTYLIFLVVYMPASYITNYVQDNTQNQVRFTGVSGTAFSGNADSLAFDGLRINDVSWKVSAASLLWLQTQVDIKGGAIRNAEQLYVGGTVMISLLSPERINVNDARLFVPAKPLLSQVNLPVAVTASGRFRVDIDSFTFDQGCQQLTGKGSWLQPAVNIEGSPLDLGGFNATLACETPSFALQVSPDNGISLDAKITVDQSGKYAALGSFIIPSNFPNEIKQGASFFGESQGQGKYNLDIKSR